MRKPRVLIAFESSGVVRRAFERVGCEAWSCDLLPADDGEVDRHIQDDIRHVLSLQIGGKYGRWDMIIAHPPCTYLCSSGLHWNKKWPERELKTEEGLRMVRWLMNYSIESGVRMVIENPIGCISSRIAKPSQIIQPYEFGDDASKSTCLWFIGGGIPKLVGTKYVEPRIVNGKKRWSNQAPCGADKTPPGPDRWKIRSKTYDGIANAMADQWGRLLVSGYFGTGELF